MCQYVNTSKLPFTCHFHCSGCKYGERTTYLKEISKIGLPIAMLLFIACVCWTYG